MIFRLWSEADCWTGDEHRCHCHCHCHYHHHYDWQIVVENEQSLRNKLLSLILVINWPGGTQAIIFWAAKWTKLLNKFNNSRWPIVTNMAIRRHFSKKRPKVLWTIQSISERVLPLLCHLNLTKNHPTMQRYLFLYLFTYI